ncbi:glutathione synthase, partial [Methylophaga nitratireducenticrescens]
MSRHIGIVMDPISAINIKKDSSFAMLLAAQAKGWTIQYMEQQDLYLSQGKVMASMRDLQVTEDANNWYQLGEPTTRRLSELDAILMRK